MSKAKKIMKYCEEHGLTRCPSWNVHAVTVPLLVTTLLRKNKYDDTETEYWVDYRTEGVRGTSEVDGMSESRAGHTDGVLAPALDDQPMASNPLETELPAGVEVEQGKKAELLLSLLLYTCCCCIACND